MTAALETLSQILHSPPQHLEAFLLSPAGFSRSYIHSVRDNRLWQRSGSKFKKKKNGKELKLNYFNR